MRKNIYNGFKEHKHFGRLIDYLEIDRTYQDYKKGIKPKDIVEEFGILHSGDIEWALNELERLNNIINELEDSIVGKINVLYQVKDQSNAIRELNIVLRKLRELKGSDKE